MNTAVSKLKVLYGYSWYESEAYGNVEQINLSYLDRLRNHGFNVDGFCLTLNPPGPCLTFRGLDALWKRGDKDLLNMYERLLNALEGKDVFINGSGINLHPEFIETLPVFSVFQCFDDPENSPNLSQPVAASYDLCLVGNIAEVGTYRQWGVKNAVWNPMGIWPEFVNPNVTFESIISGERDIDYFMMIDRLFPFRRERLDKLANAFPNAHFYGRGWPRGYLPSRLQLDYLQRTKIGPNIHNSTGPINARTFYLPANGILQVCDNKSFLGEIFEIGKEVIGFDTIEECIEICHYYREHDEERRLIAAHGWKRAMNDYTDLAVFDRAIGIINAHLYVPISRNDSIISLQSHKKQTAVKRILHDIFIKPLKTIADSLINYIIKPIVTFIGKMLN